MQIQTKQRTRPSEPNSYICHLCEGKGYMEDAETDTTISCIFCGAGSIPSNMASGFCDLCHKEFGAGKEVDTTGKTIRVITKTGLSFTAIVDNYCYNVINTMQIEDRAKETVANAR